MNTSMYAVMHQVPLNIIALATAYSFDQDIHSFSPFIKIKAYIHREPIVGPLSYEFFLLAVQSTGKG